MLNIQKTWLSISLSFLLIAGCDNVKQPEPVIEKSSTPAVQEKVSIEKEVVEKAGQTEKTSCELVMGWEPWEPYHYQDYGKEVKGLDIELMEMITAETGCKISFVKGHWMSLLQQLKIGKIDLLTGASITEKRKQYASFSDGYRTESFQLYVRAGEVGKFPGHNMKALIDNGFRLGITMDYIYNDEVNSLQDDPKYAKKISAVSNGLINYSKLFEDDIDGFLEDPVVGSSSIRRQGLETQIDLHPYSINTGDVYVMFSKASVDEATINSFNQALARIRSDGRHKRLMDKYTK